MEEQPKPHTVCRLHQASYPSTPCGPTSGPCGREVVSIRAVRVAAAISAAAPRRCVMEAPRQLGLGPRSDVVCGIAARAGLAVN